MPIPKPKDGEEEKDYIGRCMGAIGSEYDDKDQALAICYSTWKEKDKAKATELMSDIKDGLIRIAIAYTGEFERDGKKFSISLQDLRDMVKNMGDREVPLDYEHLSAKPDAPPGHSRASGWLKEPDKIEDFSGGRNILYGWAELTPASLTAIRKREYKYFSPEIHWHAEDEKGKQIGTRLAAGAITNRPFLKDLPPIEISADQYPQLLQAVALSESKRLINVQDVHVPADINTSKKGERMKKLTIKKGDGGHGIFDGEEQVGMVDGETMKKFAKGMYADELEELEELRKMKGKGKLSESAEMEEMKKMNSKLEQECAELKAKGKKMDDEMAELRGGKKKMEEELAELRKLKARTAKGGDLYIKHDGDDGDDDPDEDDSKSMTALTELVKTENHRKIEIITLTEFAKTPSGDKTMELAEKKLIDGTLPTSTYIRHQRIDRMLEQAGRTRKILPKQRQPLYELAILNFDAVQQYLNEIPKPVIDTSIRGIESSGDTMTATEELNAQVTQYMKDNPTADKIEAMRQVAAKSPELWKRHQDGSAIRVDNEGRSA